MYANKRIIALCVNIWRYNNNHKYKSNKIASSIFFSRKNKAKRRKKDEKDKKTGQFTRFRIVNGFFVEKKMMRQRLSMPISRSAHKTDWHIPRPKKKYKHKKRKTLVCTSLLWIFEREKRMKKNISNENKITLILSLNGSMRHP